MYSEIAIAVISGIIATVVGGLILRLLPNLPSRIAISIGIFVVVVATPGPVDDVALATRVGAGLIAAAGANLLGSKENKASE